METGNRLFYLVFIFSVGYLCATNKGYLYYESIPTQIFTAARLGDVEGIRMLSATYPESFSALTATRQTSLHLAARYGHYTLVYVLLTEVFSPRQVLDIQDEDGDTALHEAVDNNRKRIIVLLLQAGADIYIKNDAELSPFEKAVEESSQDIVLLFLPYIDKAMRANAQSDTLHMALMNKDPQVFKVLVQAGFNIYAQNSRRQTLLHIAAEYNECTLGKVLLAAGLEINEQDVAGQTPLHKAALRGNDDFVSFLLSRGAKTDIPDKNGSVPLVCAQRAQADGRGSRLSEENACLDKVVALLHDAKLAEDLPEERQTKRQKMS